MHNVFWAVYLVFSKEARSLIRMYQRDEIILQDSRSVIIDVLLSFELKIMVKKLKSRLKKTINRFEEIRLIRTDRRTIGF